MAKLSQAKIDALARVRARHKAATAKASRLRRNGVEVSGTGIDPRRDLGIVKNYNVRQLEAYEAQLNDFTSRRTSFIAGSENKPIPGNAWKRYKRLERQVNEMFRGRLDQIGSVNIPTSGMTIAQRQAMMENKFPTMHGRAANNPYSIVERRPSQITSEKALAKFTADMEKRLSDTYEYSTNRKARSNVRDMLKDAGLESLQGRINKLSAHQFRLMWAFTKFADDLSLRYENMKATAAQGQGRARQQQIENAAASIEHHLDFAESQPTSAPKSQSTENVFGGLRNNGRRTRKR